VLVSWRSLLKEEKENSPISGDTTTPGASEPDAKGTNALKLLN
jgi:hypothetical protein